MTDGINKKYVIFVIYEFMYPLTTAHYKRE